jgi:hypothetical protein
VSTVAEQDAATEIPREHLRDTLARLQGLENDAGWRLLRQSFITQRAKILSLITQPNVPERDADYARGRFAAIGDLLDWPAQQAEAIRKEIGVNVEGLPSDESVRARGGPRP